MTILYLVCGAVGFRASQRTVSGGNEEVVKRRSLRLLRSSWCAPTPLRHARRPCSYTCGRRRPASRRRYCRGCITNGDVGLEAEHGPEAFLLLPFRTARPRSGLPVGPSSVPRPVRQRFQIGDPQADAGRPVGANGECPCPDVDGRALGHVTCLAAKVYHFGECVRPLVFHSAPSEPVPGLVSLYRSSAARHGIAHRTFAYDGSRQGALRESWRRRRRRSGATAAGAVRVSLRPPRGMPNHTERHGCKAVPILE